MPAQPYPSSELPKQAQRRQFADEFVRERVIFEVLADDRQDRRRRPGAPPSPAPCVPRRKARHECRRDRVDQARWRARWPPWMAMKVALGKRAKTRRADFTSGGERRRAEHRGDAVGALAGLVCQCHRLLRVLGGVLGRRHAPRARERRRCPARAEATHGLGHTGGNCLRAARPSTPYSHVFDFLRHVGRQRRPLVVQLRVQFCFASGRDGRQVARGCERRWRAGEHAVGSLFLRSGSSVRRQLIVHVLERVRRVFGGFGAGRYRRRSRCRRWLFAPAPSAGSRSRRATNEALADRSSAANNKAGVGTTVRHENNPLRAQRPCDGLLWYAVPPAMNGRPGR